MKLIFLFSPSFIVSFNGYLRLAGCIIYLFFNPWYVSFASVRICMSPQTYLAFCESRKLISVLQCWHWLFSALRSTFSYMLSGCCALYERKLLAHVSLCVTRLKNKTNSTYFVRQVMLETVYGAVHSPAMERKCVLRIWLLTDENETQIRDTKRRERGKERYIQRYQ